MDSAAQALWKHGWSWGSGFDPLPSAQPVVAQALELPRDVVLAAQLQVVR
jgi:hypothetical protein